MPQTWLIVGGTRGIGYEFVSQVLKAGNSVLATYRSLSSAAPLQKLQESYRETLEILQCDVTSEESIKELARGVRAKLASEAEGEGVIDVVVVNAGILEYPNRVSEMNFATFNSHLQTNTIGPLMTAQHLLRLSPHITIETLVFISSDSGSAARFRGFEDGFAAYAASKAALNMGIRHLACELQRQSHAKEEQSQTQTQTQTHTLSLRPPPVVLALHPGEVLTDMARNVDVDWEVQGVIEAPESIRCMMGVVAEKGRGGADEGGKTTGGRVEEGEASFWTWEGVRYPW